MNIERMVWLKILFAILVLVKNMIQQQIGATDESYTDKAKSKCKDILGWLYLIGTDTILKTSTMYYKDVL
jgi:hypothetical protein